MTLAFVGRNVNFGIDQFDLTGQGNELKAKRDSAVIDATGFGSRFENTLSGVQKASIEAKGHYAPGQTLDGVINQRFGQDSDVLAWYAPMGYSLLTPQGTPSPLVMQPSVITKYDLDAKLKGGVEIDMTMMARGYVDDGYVYQTPNVFTTVTGNTPTAIDNTLLGGATAAGGNAQLHVIGTPTGTTPAVTAKIQHSTDGSTWADLITFTAATTATSQRIVLPKQTVVNAFTRGLWTVTGTTPSFTMLLGFARGVVYS